ncbi:MAG: cation transporter [Clostridium sp.]|nr:cation transporter [Clostridium sp.]
MKKKILIDGMMCDHCVSHVKNALSAIEGVIAVEVNLAGKYALVDTDVSNDRLTEAIEDEGYDVVKIEE